LPDERLKEGREEETMVFNAEIQNEEATAAHSQPLSSSIPPPPPSLHLAWAPWKEEEEENGKQNGSRARGWPGMGRPAEMGEEGGRGERRGAKAVRRGSSFFHGTRRCPLRSVVASLKACRPPMMGAGRGA
jgi:hypothetical protein